MVVRLALERDGEAVAEIENAGVLAGPLEHTLALRRQPLQERRRMLVAAVLRPEEGKNRQLELVRRATEQTPDYVEFPVREAERAV